MEVAFVGPCMGFYSKGAPSKPSFCSEQVFQAPRKKKLAMRELEAQVMAKRYDREDRQCRNSWHTAPARSPTGRTASDNPLSVNGVLTAGAK